jgi:hypothetical protein
MENLTELERKVVKQMIEELTPWIGCESYTSLTAEDLVKKTEIESKTLRGVLSSLIKKEIIFSFETEISGSMFKPDEYETFFGFEKQEEKTVEELEKLLN